MPDFGDIRISDFETALKIYLERWVKEGKKNRSIWETVAWNLPFGIGGERLEDVDDVADRLHADIMDAVEQYGLSPNVMQALSPDAARMFGTVFQRRVQYEWDKQGEEDWRKEVASLSKQAITDWRTEQATELSKAKFQAQQQQWQWQQQQSSLGRQEAGQRWKSELATRNVEAEMARRQADEFRLGRQQLERTERQVAGLQTLESESGFPQSPESRQRFLQEAYGQIMAGMGGNVNWINRARVTAQYQNLRQSLQEDSGDDTLMQSRSARQQANRVASETSQAIESGELNEKQLADAIKREDIMEKRAEKWETAHIKAREQYEKFGGAVARQPSPLNPATPAWLSPLTGVPTGQLISKEEQASPVSGQFFNRLLPSEREKLTGYLRFAGQDPQDFFQVSQSQLPQPVRRPIAWRAAQQRI